MHVFSAVSVRVALGIGLIISMGHCGKLQEVHQTQPDIVTKTSECITEYLQQCRDLQKEIDELTQQRDASSDDTLALAQITLQLNYKVELLNLYQTGERDQKSFKTIDNKYQLLLKLLEQTSNQEGLKFTALNIAYHPLEVSALREIYQDFGELYVKIPTQEPTASWSEEYAVDMPWAGYWYPLHGDALFAGANAPLNKLDKVAMNLGRASSASAWESNRYNVIYPESWEGMCGALSLASTRYKEPKRGVTVAGVFFSIADQKALLTKAHESFATKTYGIRYNGDTNTDGTLQDIRPEAWQQIMITMLRDRRTAVIVDDDPGLQVWNKPIYRVRWVMRLDPDVPNALHVQAWPWFVRQRQAETDDPTTVSDRSAPEYEYRLYYDPETQNNDGAYRVVAGEWIRQSIGFHPDSVLFPAADAALKSLNPEFNRNIDLLEQIIAAGSTE